MTASDKKKTAILALLVIVAIGTWMWMYGSASTTSTTGAATKGGKPSASLNSPPDAQIRIDMIGDTSGHEVGRRNLFAYRQKPAPPMPEPPRVVIPTPTTPTFIDRPPQPPPPPPFKAFRYEGFSVNRATGKLLGSVSESGNTYEVAEGDYLMGQYHITRLTETLVEIEDLQLKRKQTFTRAQ